LGAVVGPTCRAGPRDTTGPGGWLACSANEAGDGHTGKARQAIIERNPYEKKCHTRWNTSHLTSTDNTSNRMHNNYICEF
jgi:hypothetical protein